MSANDDVYLIGSRHVAPLFYVLPWSAGTDRVESLCWKQTLHLQYNMQQPQENNNIIRDDTMPLLHDMVPVSQQNKTALYETTRCRLRNSFSLERR